MKSVTIIIPYFGKFPQLFKFWWASALNNPTIKFLIFTDNNDVQSEGNITIHHMSFAECKELVQRAYDFQISLPSPYKLCDQKGGYPMIFKDFVGDSDFVGWGDIDLIYGNLRSFITDDVLDHYDVISGWGHLTLLRNTEYWRNFYKLEVDGFLNYKDVFVNPQNFVFDEYWHGGLSDKAVHLHPDKVWNPMCFDDLEIPMRHIDFFSSNRRGFENQNLIFEYSDGQMWRIYLQADRIYREPTMYVHFQRRLNLLRFDVNASEHYLIVPNEIIQFEKLTVQKIRKWTQCDLLTQKYFEIFYRVENKLKRLHLGL